MIARFNLYDFITAVIPGVLFIWAVSLVAHYFDLALNIPLSGNLTETSVLIVLAYVIGLLLQGISQGVTERILLKLWNGFPSARWLLSEDNYLSKDYKKRILEIVNNRFGIEYEKDGLPINEQLKKNQEIFYLCYSAVEKEKLSEKPQIFNAHYGLFRCLLTTFVILLLFDFVIIVFTKTTKPGVFYSHMSIFFSGATISYFRAKKRGEDFAKSIYDLFLVRFSKPKGEAES